jgi:hypothetical protein
MDTHMHEESPINGGRHITHASPRGSSPAENAPLIDIDLRARTSIYDDEAEDSKDPIGDTMLLLPDTPPPRKPHTVAPPPQRRRQRTAARVGKDRSAETLRECAALLDEVGRMHTDMQIKRAALHDTLEEVNAAYEEYKKRSTLTSTVAIICLLVILALSFELPFFYRRA